MADFQALETWAEDLLKKLAPTARKRLLLDIARTLRAENAARMQAQTGPDGDAWEPRKPTGATLRSRRARLRQQAKQRRPLFEKMRKLQYLKARTEEGAAVVEFADKAQRIARVHHFGQTDNVNPSGPRYRYPARELIGISAADADMLRERIIGHLEN